MNGPVWASATESMESPFHLDGKGNTKRLHLRDTLDHLASPHFLNVKTVKGFLNCLEGRSLEGRGEWEMKPQEEKFGVGK